VLRIVQSALAEQDLVDIWVFTAEQWSFEQADSYLEVLVAGFERLTEHPQLGIARDDLRTGYRALTINQHIAFYTVVSDDIQIIRVLHKSVDTPRHL
jgi:toxin ParE1/3/4